MSIEDKHKLVSETFSTKQVFQRKDELNQAKNEQK